MKPTSRLRREHASILTLASTLNGLAGSRMTRDIADQTQACMRSIDALLVGHLLHEDEHLYPALMAADDQQVRIMAEDCFADMGGILGAWIAYRDHWTAETIRTQPDRFSSATTGVLGALAIRIERENQELYPLLDHLQATAEHERRMA